MSLNKKRILFLDCDGVLNNFEWIYANDRNRPKYEYHKGFIDPDRLSMINFMSDYGFEIVLTASMRKRLSIPEFTMMFAELGCRMPVIGRTGSTGKRGEEITNFLNDNNLMGADFIILEDEPSDMLEHQENIVKCNSKVGIDENIVSIIKEKIKVIIGD